MVTINKKEYYGINLAISCIILNVIVCKYHNISANSIHGIVLYAYSFIYNSIVKLIEFIFRIFTITINIPEFDTKKHEIASININIFTSITFFLLCLLLLLNVTNISMYKYILKLSVDYCFMLSVLNLVL